MANNINISPVISPDITRVISKSSPIKSFGAQTKDKNKEILIVGNQTKTAQLDEEINILDKKEQKAGEEKNRIEQEAIYKLNTKQITQNQYDKIIKTASTTLIASKAIIDLNRVKLQQDKNNIDNNPYTRLQNNQKLINNEIKAVDKSIVNTENKSKRDLVKQVLSNPIKTLPSILSLQLSNSLSVLIFQRKKLENLVDQVNLYIDTQVKDQNTVTVATNLRNNALTLINNSIKKLQSLEKILKTITSLISLLNLIIPLLNPVAALPVISTPPGAPIPGIILHDNIRDRKFNLQRLVSSLSSILIVVTLLLSNEITNLIELRDRLKEISLQLDTKAFNNLNEQELNQLSDEFLPVGIGGFNSYKGFNFKIKEEQDPRFVVKGNKRKYAVAIDRYGVEAIKSEYSFTQDPDDLIEQLKLIIDQQNLQG